jgi:hypothetical protein
MLLGGIYSDLKIISFFLTVGLIISLLIFYRKKDALLSVSFFSVVSNLILYYGMDYHFADVFRILWLFQFSKNIWPFINVIILFLLIIKFIKNKNAKAE